MGNIFVAVILLNIYGGLPRTNGGLPVSNIPDRSVPNNPIYQAPQQPPELPNIYPIFLESAILNDIHIFHGQFHIYYQQAPGQIETLINNVLNAGMEHPFEIVTTEDIDGTIQGRWLFRFFIDYWYSVLPPHECLLTNPLLTNRRVTAVFVACTGTDMTGFLFQVFVDNNLNLQDAEGNSVLHHAILLPDIALFHLWIDAGLPVNQKNNEGDTPLHHAIRENRGPICIQRLSLAAGANVNLCYPAGRSPLEYAISTRQPANQGNGLLKDLCVAFTRPSLGIGYAMTFAFRSQNEVNTDEIVYGIFTALTRDDNDNDNENVDFEKVHNFISTWKNLIQHVFHRMSKVIVVEVEKGFRANVEVDQIDKLYLLVFRRAFHFTANSWPCPHMNPSEADLAVGMMTEIANAGSGGTRQNDQVGRIRFKQDVDDDKWVLTRDKPETSWTVDDLGNATPRFDFEVVDNEGEG